jgi:hypothetical protein
VGALIHLPFRVTSLRQVKGLPGMGLRTLDTIQEIQGWGQRTPHRSQASTLLRSGAQGQWRAGSGAPACGVRQAVPNAGRTPDARTQCGARHATSCACQCDLSRATVAADHYALTRFSEGAVT